MLEVTSSLSADLIQQHEQHPFDLLLVLGHQLHHTEHTLTDKLVWVGPQDMTSLPKTLSLVLAPEGCVYRRKIVQVLDDKHMPWRISFTNYDLSGITAAINEGLGITALARSTVPPELKELNLPALPNLGQVSIHLTSFNETSQVAHTLKEFMFNRLAVMAG